MKHTIQDIMNLAISYMNDKDIDVFVRYAGHVNKLEVSINYRANYLGIDSQNEVFYKSITVTEDLLDYTELRKAMLEKLSELHSLSHVAT